MRLLRTALTKTFQSDDGYALAWNLSARDKMPLFDTDDTGKFVAGILLQPSGRLGQRVFGATDWYSVEQIVSTIEKVSGKKVKYQEVPDEMFKSFLPAEIAEETTQTLIFMREYAYYGPGAEEALVESLKVCPVLKRQSDKERKLTYVI